jgi:hypothetical protein
MATSRFPNLRRRALLGIPPLVAAALTITVKPDAASAAPAAAPKSSPIECVADLLRES